MLSVNIMSSRKDTFFTARISCLQSCFNQIGRIAKNPRRHACDPSCQEQTDIFTRVEIELLASRLFAAGSISNTITFLDKEHALIHTKLPLEVLIRAEIEGETRRVTQKHPLIALQEAFGPLRLVNSPNLLSVANRSRLIELRTDFEQIKDECDIGVVKACDAP